MANKYKCAWDCANSEKCNSCSLGGYITGDYKSGYTASTHEEIKEEGLQATIYDTENEAEEAGKNLANEIDVVINWWAEEIEN